MPKSSLVALALVAAASCPGTASAQSAGGTLTGIITDASGEIYTYDHYQGTTFPAPIPADGALFLSGGLGADSLSGYLAGQNVPQVGRYIYLRADDSTTNQTDDGGAHVLQDRFPADCVYGALTATAVAGC